MARSPLILAYLATVNPTERGMVGPNTPPRPEGVVVWACCAGLEQLGAIETLSNRLADDGEVITIFPTVPQPQKAQSLASPNTKRSARAFLAHWKPQFVLWVGGTLDATVLFEVQNSGIPALLVCADFDDIDKSGGRRVPGLLRNLLATFAEIQSVDASSAQRLIKAGSDAKTTKVTGLLEEGITPPLHDETLRAQLSADLINRPMWHAADAPMAELNQIAEAHRHAARRAHRTLLVLSPRDASDGSAMAEALRELNFSVACRSLGETPKESTQIYVVDTSEGIGLWSRLAPITYLGGSLSDGVTCDPFDPATVGSAVLAGPTISAYRSHYDRLMAGHALLPVRTTGGFGGCVEQLLATDLAAQLAHNAWDVTSRGAEATDKLVALVYDYLDRVSA